MIYNNNYKNKIEMLSLEEYKLKEMSKKISKTKLTFSQNKAYSLLTQGKNVYLTGMAGTGKTFILKIFVDLYKNSKNIALTSTTGTSALLVGGTTLHSYLGIGLGNSSYEVLEHKILKNKWLVYKWTKVDCLIIDEVSMLEPDLFDKIEKLARKIRQNEKPFGNIQIVLSGDFCQLPPINSEKFCFEAKSWDNCISLENTVYFQEIVRQSDVVFQNCLNNIRLGNITEDVRSILDSRIGVKLKNNFNIKATKLFSKNHLVDKINNEELDKLSTNENVEFFQYEMEITTNPSLKNPHYSIEKFKKYCNAQMNLELCVGAQVMLLYNKDITLGLVNGSRGVVINFTKHLFLPRVRFLNGEEHVINYHSWFVEENDKIILTAEQIPLKIAYAISIHKCQGSSLDYAELDLSDIFEYGQAYVALSRVKNLEGISIIGIDYDNIVAHPDAIEYYDKIN